MRLACLIPVYNAANYLPACLDSVLAQGVSHLEIFCCDDGSTDGSLPVLNDYAARYSNVHVVTQANGGVVSARNRLLDELPPEIGAFTFMDADDCIAPGMYSALVAALERTGADVAECEWDGVERVIDDMTMYLLKQTAPGRWINVINKLYRRSAIGDIRFRSGLAFEEDYFFNYEIHAVIHRKVLVPGKFYTYRTNPNSANGRLDLVRYYDSASKRIRLSCDVFMKAGRIPMEILPLWRNELMKDAYRMCIRKNLKKNRDAASRRKLFLAAGDFFAALERDYGLLPTGLGLIQHAVYRCCRLHRYAMARLLMTLT